MMMILFLLSIGVGVWLGLKRSTWRMERRLERLNERKQGRRRRVDSSQDAPTELSQAELKAMGRWFQD
jgi:hypothetical protein